MKRFLLVVTALLCTLSAQAQDIKPYGGETLPDFTLSDLGGVSRTLGDYRGQVVMVNFWATYCGPCIKEMPSMQRLKERLAEQPFTILAINMAEEQGDIEAFLQRHKMAINFPILLDPQGMVLERWMVTAVPTTFIIDSRGTIRYALYGGLEWDSEEMVKTINTLLP